MAWDALQMHGQNFIFSTARGPLFLCLSEPEAPAEAAQCHLKGSLSPGGHRVLALPVQQSGSSPSPTAAWLF